MISLILSYTCYPSDYILKCQKVKNIKYFCVFNLKVLDLSLKYDTKVITRPNRTPLSLLTHVDPNLCDFLWSVEHERRYSE